MQIKYNVTGDRRKALVAVMRDTLQDATRYLGAPSFAFQVGAYTIDKNGTVTCLDDADSTQIDMLIRELERDGFIGERIGIPAVQATERTVKNAKQESPLPQSDDPDRLAIELPKDGMTPTAIENLWRLVASKATLLKKALGADSLPITEHADRIEFGWFSPTDDQAKLIAYSHLALGLCELARTQKRVSATEQEVENEKYALRCFLLRLGFIGEEFKYSRKLLLENLSGNAAFRSAREAGDEE